MPPFDALRKEAIDQVLFEESWKTERITNNFRALIWIAVGLTMSPASLRTGLLSLSWGLTVLTINIAILKNRYHLTLPWLLTTVDIIVLTLGMHAGYRQILITAPALADYHLSGTTVGLMVVLSVNMMRTSWRLAIWSGILCCIAFTTIRLINHKLNILSIVDLVLFTGMTAMLVFTTTRLQHIIRRVLIDLRDIQEDRASSFGNLVAGVAHEMNTPLGVLSSNTQLATRALTIIREGIDDSQRKPKRAVDTLQKVSDSTAVAIERLTSTIKALKNYARLDEADVQKTNIEESIDACIELLRPETRIHIIRQYGQVPDLLGRPAHLNQLFMSLLDNAIKAIEDVGELRVQTSFENHEITILITDTGKGIPAELLPKLFDVGFNSGGARTKAGFGLTTSRNIVQDHGGHLTIESKVGQGTAVKIALPHKA